MTNWQEKMRQLARSKANKWIIVAITGVTNSGKTSLASNLKKTLQPSVTVNQDPFFRVRKCVYLALHHSKIE